MLTSVDSAKPIERRPEIHGTSFRHTTGVIALDHVNRLPVELLEEVFLYIQALYGPDYGLTGMPICTFLSHVCHRWREVAIKCQRLWEEVARPFEAATQLCISRCHSRPTKLAVDSRYMQPDAEAYRRAMNVAFQALNRADALLIRLRPVNGGLGSMEELGVPGPYLAQLFGNLGVALRPNFPLKELTIDIAYAPDAILGIAHLAHGTLMRLEVACFAGCFLQNPGLVLSPNMRLLKLHNTDAWSTSEEMIAVLRATPLLEVLHYSHSQRRAAPFHITEPVPLQQVHLHKLAQLHLGSFLPEDVAIYAAICMPGHVAICSYSCHEILDPTSMPLGQHAELLSNTVSESMSMLRDAFFIRNTALLSDHSSLLSVHVLKDAVISFKIFVHDPNIHCAPLQLACSMDVQLPRHGYGHAYMLELLLVIMCALPRKSHCLYFDGTLPLIRSLPLQVITRHANQLVLQTSEDMRALIQVLPRLQPPSLV